MKYDLTGYNIDNLLKTLYMKKVTLLNVERVGHNQVKFEVPAAQEKKVKKYITNFKGTLTPNFFKRLPKLILTHISLLVALFVGVLFHLFAGNYVWQIRIFGTNELNPNEVISVLNQNGVKVGKLNLTPSEEIEEILLTHYDRLAQVSVVKKGSAIIINLSEKLVYNQTEFEPIVAKFAGVITKINVITGTCCVSTGEYVNAGDTLVLPYNQDKQGKQISVKPMAEIWADMFVVGSVKLNKTTTELVRTGKTQKVYTYSIFNRKLFSGKNKNLFALFENVSYNEIISDLVPLKRTTTVFYELAPKQVEHDFGLEADAQIEQSRIKAEKLVPSGCEVKSTSHKTEQVGDTFYAYTTINFTGRIND